MAHFVGIIQTTTRQDGDSMLQSPSKNKSEFIMKATKVSLFGCLMLTLSASWLHAKPLLNGLAVSTEFGKERFIAALYSDRLTTDVQQMLDGSGHRRMELKVTANSISARSINSMWIEGMAINNSASTLEAQAENLAKLNNMVRKRLRAGDVLAFDAESGNGTTVTLNGVKLGTINSDDFFPMLLRTWIGSIPLSSNFKESLLAGGTVDGELSARYASIKPDEARIAAVANWVAPTPPQPQVAADAVIPPKPDTNITPPPPVTKVVQAPAKAGPEKTKVAATASSKPSLSAEPKPKTTPPDPVKPASTKVAKTAPAPEPDHEAKEDEAEEVMVTAQSLLVRQRYISDVMQKVLKNMRYPRRAQERDQEGSIRLAVTITRDGKLQDVRMVDDSPYRLLNREALDSVKRANPFPKVPDGVGGETFSFGIPVTFRLQ
jgi:periplasmic protein TonB